MLTYQLVTHDVMREMVRLRSVYTTVLACISQGFCQLVSGLATQNVSPIVSPQLPLRCCREPSRERARRTPDIYLWGA